MANGRDPAKFQTETCWLIGFDDSSALNLIGPADSFTAAGLDDGYGNRISVLRSSHDRSIFRSTAYRKRPFFQAQHTLSAAPELDTIIIAGGRGVLRPEVRDKISDVDFKTH